MYHIYFAKSMKNGKVYGGFTSKIPSMRVQEHNQGSSDWSRQNGPLRLIYYEEFECKEDALRREKFFKTGIGKRIKKVIVQELTA